MHAENLLAALVISSLTTAANVLGQLSSTTTISVGEAMGVFVFIASLVVWLARKLQKIEDDIDRSKAALLELKTAVESKPCNPLRRNDCGH